MKSEQKIRLGLPKGSLNNESRWSTYKILTDAGYLVRGYEPGKESDKDMQIANDNDIKPILCRPQTAPIELTRGMLDVAIIGEDWVQERMLSGIEGVRKIGDLEYGQTRIVMATRDSKDYSSLYKIIGSIVECDSTIRCFTEYPNITKRWLMQKDEYKTLFDDKAPLMEMCGISTGDTDRVQIITSFGLTEGFVNKGADFIVDNTQTGRTLREYGLVELETIMESSAGLYAGPDCKGWKEEKVQEIFEALKGPIVGRRYFNVKFNVPAENTEQVRKYLLEERLCSDEPTIVLGEKISVFDILIPKERYPKIRSKLRQDYRATGIINSTISSVIE